MGNSEKPKKNRHCTSQECKKKKEKKKEKKKKIEFAWFYGKSPY